MPKRCIALDKLLYRRLKEEPRSYCSGQASY